MQISGIVRSDITVNPGETLTLTAPVQLADDATILVRAGGIFDLSNFRIQNFGQIELQGDSDNFAIMKNGTYSTDSTSGILVSDFGEIRSLSVDGFFSDGQLNIDNSLIVDSWVQALEDTTISNTAFINSDFDVGIQNVSVDQTTFFDSLVTIDSWPAIEFETSSTFINVNFISRDTAIYLDSWAKSEYNFNITNGFINSESIDDKVYDADDDLNVSFDITSSSFNDTPYINDPRGFAVGNYIISTSSLYSGEPTDITDINSDIKFVNIGPDGGLYSADILVDGIELITAEEAQLYRSYYGAMGRLPDQHGYEWWLDEIYAGRHTLASMSTGFINSPEFISLADQNNNNSIEDIELLMHLYQGVFGREPDQAGYEWWLNQLETGAMKQEEVFTEMTQSDEYIELTAQIVADMQFL